MSHGRWLTPPGGPEREPVGQLQPGIGKPHRSRSWCEATSTSVPTRNTFVHPAVGPGIDAQAHQGDEIGSGPLCEDAAEEFTVHDAMKHAITLAALFAITSTPVGSGARPARGGASGTDLATVERIRTEATERSQAVDHAWWLSEVYGPRPTGSPGFSQASEWAMKRFTEWGLKNVHQERFAFGQGWTIDRFSVHLVTPQTQAFIGQPRWYSPSTNGPVLADVVHVKATTDADLAKYKGQLRGKIVIMQAPRAVRMLDGRIILRMGDEEWNEAMTVPEPVDDAAPWPERRATRSRGVPADAAEVPGRRRRGRAARARQRQRRDAWRQRPLVDAAPRGRRHDLPHQRWQPRRPGAAAGALGHARRGALQPRRAPHRARSAGADGSEHQDDVPPRDRGGRKRHQHHRRDPRDGPRLGGRDARRALRQLSLCRWRHRQRHRIGGDDGSRARHPGAWA